MRNRRFSENLLALLSQTGRTQAELAAHMGVNQTSVSRWLHDSEPRMPVMAKLAAFFGVSVEALKNENFSIRLTETHETNKFPDRKSLENTLRSEAKRLREVADRLDAQADNLKNR